MEQKFNVTALALVGVIFFLVGAVCGQLSTKNGVGNPNCPTTASYCVFNHDGTINTIVNHGFEVSK